MLEHNRFVFFMRPEKKKFKVLPFHSHQMILSVYRLVYDCNLVWLMVVWFFSSSRDDTKKNTHTITTVWRIQKKSAKCTVHAYKISNYVNEMMIFAICIWNLCVQVNSRLATAANIEKNVVCVRETRFFSTVLFLYFLQSSENKRDKLCANSKQTTHFFYSCLWFHQRKQILFVGKLRLYRSKAVKFLICFSEPKSN